MCFVVNKFLHLFQVLRNFQNTATAINAPPSPLLFTNLRTQDSFNLNNFYIYVCRSKVPDLITIVEVCFLKFSLCKFCACNKSYAVLYQ